MRDPADDVEALQRARPLFVYRIAPNIRPGPTLASMMTSSVSARFGKVNAILAASQRFSPHNQRYADVQLSERLEKELHIVQVMTPVVGFE